MKQFNKAKISYTLFTILVVSPLTQLEDLIGWI